ncbi:MAG TPA: hypothetical protein VH255_01570, partial [Verrucomicrobiae bacterium]|nr:hypothetical protein [Verrucomicrobiae bacterium]
MDRQIEQTYAPVWRLIKITGAMFLSVLIICGGIAYLNGQQNLKYLFTGLAIMGFGLTIILSLVVFVVSGQGTKWFVTENGLKRVQLSGGKKTILWKQI